jgi:hypothetical protein
MEPHQALHDRSDALLPLSWRLADTDVAADRGGHLVEAAREHGCEPAAGGDLVAQDLGHLMCCRGAADESEQRDKKRVGEILLVEADRLSEAHGDDRRPKCMFQWLAKTEVSDQR